LARPTVANGYLLVGDYEGYLHILSEDDGGFIGRIKVDSSGISAPLIVDGKIIYVLDNDGAVSAYEFL
jgi:outer membrane protein assembly factor BamB